MPRARVNPEPGASANTGFLGHPRGLFYLAFTEAWERFSFYGMTAVLVLYMVNQLLLPGHVEHVAGFAAFRAFLESVSGSLSPLALASMVFGLYSGFVYFTPVFGGLVADRWIGQRNAVVAGALSMSAGHVCMVFDQSFLLALLLLVVGSGLLKGNISTQVGALYAPAEEDRRTRGFAIFSMAINIGAVFGPLLCGFLAQVYGWHYGFGIAAVFMLAGLATYLAGYRHLPARVPRRIPEGVSDARIDWRLVSALLAVMLITVFQSASYYQLYNVYKIWIQHHVNLQLGGFTIPVPWYQSVDALSSILVVPPLVWWWRKRARSGGGTGELGKIGTGAWIAAASYLLLVIPIALSGGEQISFIWPVLCSAGMGLGFIYQWPTLLALVSRAAPAKINATLMGVAFLSLFISNNLVGWLGGFYERMNPAVFWLMHAGIAALGGLLILMTRGPLSRVLATGAVRPLRRT